MISVHRVAAQLQIGKASALQSTQEIAGCQKTPHADPRAAAACAQTALQHDARQQIRRAAKAMQQINIVINQTVPADRGTFQKNLFRCGLAPALPAPQRQHGVGRGRRSAVAQIAAVSGLRELPRRAVGSPAGPRIRAAAVSLHVSHTMPFIFLPVPVRMPGSVPMRLPKTAPGSVPVRHLLRKPMTTLPPTPPQCLPRKPASYLPRYPMPYRPLRPVRRLPQNPLSYLPRYPSSCRFPLHPSDHPA